MTDKTIRRWIVITAFVLSFFLSFTAAYGAVDAWTDAAAQLDGQISILALKVFNGLLFGGTANGGRLFEYGEAPPPVSGQVIRIQH